MSEPDFLSLAAQTFQLADHTATPEDRTTLLNMAQAWLEWGKQRGLLAP